MQSTQQIAGERRRHPRHALRLPWTVQTPDGLEFQVQSADISQGGMRVETDEMLPPCGVCTLVATDPSAPELELEATVLRCQEQGQSLAAGLWFDSLSEADSESLHTMLDAVPERGES
jgi:c-di-GMP-binding flagellar brake protein YcgR